VVVDMTFFSANLLKLLEGAWVPLLFGVAMAIMIWTWRRGSTILTTKTRRIEVPLGDLIKSLERRPPHIVKGTAVFLTSDPSFVSRRSLKPSAQSGMPLWQDHMFIALSRSANDATDYFQIPTGRVVEVGTQVTI